MHKAFRTFGRFYSELLSCFIPNFWISDAFTQKTAKWPAPSRRMNDRASVNMRKRALRTKKYRHIYKSYKAYKFYKLDKGVGGCFCIEYSACSCICLFRHKIPRQPRNSGCVNYDKPILRFVLLV